MNLRDSNIERLANENYDVLIIGSGINGAVSAASLSARGVKVALIDRGDFASGTSSESSNLAWGGITYLESYEFLLVNNLCKSRNHLMKKLSFDGEGNPIPDNDCKRFSLSSYSGLSGCIALLGIWPLFHQSTQLPQRQPAQAV